MNDLLILQVEANHGSGLLRPLRICQDIMVPVLL